MQLSFSRNEVSIRESHILYNVLVFLKRNELLSCERACPAFKGIIEIWCIWKTLLKHERGLKDSFFPTLSQKQWKQFYFNFHQDYNVRIADQRNELSAKFYWRNSVKDLLQIPELNRRKAEFSPHGIFHPGRSSREFYFGPAECCKRHKHNKTESKSSSRLRLLARLKNHRRSETNVGNCSTSSNATLGNSFSFPSSPDEDYCVDCCPPDSRSRNMIYSRLNENCCKLSWQLVFAHFDPDQCKIWLQTRHAVYVHIRLSILGEKHSDPPIWTKASNYYFTQVLAGPSSGPHRRINQRIEDEVRFNISGLGGLLMKMPDVCIELDLTVLTAHPHHIHQSIKLLYCPALNTLARSTVLINLTNSLIETSKNSSSKLQHRIQRSVHLELLIRCLDNIFALPTPLMPSLLIHLAAIFDSPCIVLEVSVLANLVESTVRLLSTLVQKFGDKSEPKSIALLSRRNSSNGSCSSFSMEGSSASSSTVNMDLAAGATSSSSPISITAGNKNLLSSPSSTNGTTESDASSTCSSSVLTRASSVAESNSSTPEKPSSASSSSSSSSSSASSSTEVPLWKGAAFTHMPNSLITYSFGLLYNLVKRCDCRRLLTSNPDFLPALLNTLSDPAMVHAHFSCLHIMAVLIHKSHLPKPYTSVFWCHLQAFLAYFPSPIRTSNELFSHLGMELTPRDLADFYIPMLHSKNIDCVRLGAFVISMFYRLSV